MNNKTNFIFKINYHIRINKLFDKNMSFFSDTDFDEIHNYNKSYNTFIYNYLKILVNQYFDSHHLQKPFLLRKIKIMNYLFFLYIKDNSYFPNLMDNLDFISCLYKSIDIFDSYIDSFNKDNWVVEDFFTKIINYVKNETSFKIEQRIKPVQYKTNSNTNRESNDDSSDNLSDTSSCSLKDYISKYNFYQCPIIITFVILFLECVITSGKMPDIKDHLMYSTEQFETSFIEFNNNVPGEEKKTFLENYVEETKNYMFFKLLNNYKWILNFSKNEFLTNNVLIKEYNVMVLICKMLKNPIMVKCLTFSGIFVESKIYITGSGASFETIKRSQIFNRVVENVVGKIKSRKYRSRIKKNNDNLSDFDNLFKETIDSSKDIHIESNSKNTLPEFDKVFKETIYSSNEIYIESNFKNTTSNDFLEPIKQIFCSKKRKVENVFDREEVIDFFYFPYNFGYDKKFKTNKRFCKFYLDPEETEYLKYVLS